MGGTCSYHVDSVRWVVLTRGCTNSDGVKIRSYKKYSVVTVSRPALDPNMYFLMWGKNRIMSHFTLFY